MSPMKASVGAKLRSMKEGPRNQLLFVWALTGPIALILALLLLVAVVRMPDPAEHDVPAEIAATDNAKNWASNYLLLWLGGTGPSRGEDESPNLRLLREMSSVPGEFTLPTSPYTVQDISPVSATAIPAGEDTIWRMEMSATVVSPGSSGVTRLQYALDITEHSGGYQATALPRLVNSTTTPFSINTLYAEHADPSSAMYKSAEAFATAYLTPDTGGNFGATVSGNYSGVPLTNSPYSKVTVTSVMFYLPDMSVDMLNVQSGDVAHALITVRAESSTSTFNYTQLPVKMVVLDNLQWAVDAMEDFVDIGETVPR